MTSLPTGSDAFSEPAILDIDLDAPHGRALLTAAATAHGALLIPAAQRLSRIFLLRSPWAPGLRFVGGQAVHDDGPDGLCDRRVFSQSGPAETLETALASCVGEAIELLSQTERAGDVARSETVAGAGPDVWRPSLAAIGAQVRTTQSSDAAALDWMRARELATGRDVLVPAEWCVRRRPERIVFTPAWPIGTGVAAGPSWEWAASRALLELIERDAAAHWWIGGRRGRPLALDDPALAEAARLAAFLRQDQTTRSSWLLDITTDLGVPCVAALSCDEDGRGLVCGFGARTTMTAAARSALLENAQMEMALMMARAKTRHVGAGQEVQLDDGDRRALALATGLDAATCDLLHPAGAPRRHLPAPGTDDVAPLAALLDAREIEVALVDLTRPEFGLPVVRALAPGLQSIPSDIVTPRLQRTLAETGGGARYTGGTRLF